MTIARAEMKKGFAALWDSNQYSLPADMKAALQRGKDSEGGEVARLHFQINLESLAQTSSARIPLCGDTGLPMYYVVLGERVIDKIDGGLAALFEELREAVRRATVSVPMRRNVVDPITRQEHPDSVGEIVPFIDYRLEPGGRYLEVTAVALGGGPELTCQARILGAVEGVQRPPAAARTANAASQPAQDLLVGRLRARAPDVVENSLPQRRRRAAQCAALFLGKQAILGEGLIESSHDQRLSGVVRGRDRREILFGDGAHAWVILDGAQEHGGRTDGVDGEVRLAV